MNGLQANGKSAREFAGRCPNAASGLGNPLAFCRSEREIHLIRSSLRVGDFKIGLKRKSVFMKKKNLIAAGLSLLVLTAVWQFAFVPRLTERIPPGWSWSADFIGIGNFADPETGDFFAKDITNVYERRMYVAAESERPRSISVEDTFAIFDPATNKKIWEYNYRAEIDPRTGGHLQKEYLGDYYVFPRFVEKKTYNFRNNYIKGVPLAFSREEDVEGIGAYLFSYRGRGEYTESYAGTAEYPGTKIEPGQEIKCDDDQFILNVWVEPVTGEILKSYEACLSGDYVFDAATGRRLSLIFRWDGETAGDDNVERAKIVGWERARLLWITRYIPLALLSAGLLCFGLAFIPKKLSKKEYV